jgi:hypothetical protein
MNGLFNLTAPIPTMVENVYEDVFQKLTREAAEKSMVERSR